MQIPVVVLPITITVNNLGTTAQSNIPVSYKIGTGTPVNEVLVGPLAANTSGSYSFTTKANISTLDAYSIEAKTNLTGDALPTNDTFTKVVTYYSILNTPAINASGTSTLCTGGTVTLTAASSTTGVTFQWQMNGTPIAGGTSATYVANAAGSYTATATVAGNCSSPAAAATVLTMNTNPPAPGINHGSSLALCNGDSVALMAVSSVPGATFTWFLNVTVIPGAIAATYIAKAAGSCTAVATVNGCGSAASLARTVTMKSPPVTPVITQSGFVLTSSSNSSNQWYKNNVIITGANAKKYIVTSNGNYTVKATSNSCASATSNAVTVINTGLGENMAGLDVMVYPNPSSGLFSIELPQGKGYELTVTDLTGKIIQHKTVKAKTAQLDLNQAAKGVYLLKIFGANGTAVRKLIVE